MSLPDRHVLMLFVPRHGELDDEAFLEGLPRRPAVARGRIRRTARRRVLLVPNDDGPSVYGHVVEVDAARLQILDHLQGVGGGVVVRRPVRVSVSLRMIEAEAYISEER